MPLSNTSTLFPPDTKTAHSPGMTIRVEPVLKSSSGCRQSRSPPGPVFLITFVQCFFPWDLAFSPIPNSAIVWYLLADFVCLVVSRLAAGPFSVSGVILHDGREIVKKNGSGERVQKEAAASARQPLSFHEERPFADKLKENRQDGDSCRPEMKKCI